MAVYSVPSGTKFIDLLLSNHYPKQNHDVVHFRNVHMHIYLIALNFETHYPPPIGNIGRFTETIFAYQRFTVDYVIHQKCFTGLIFVVLGQFAKITNIMHLKNLALYGIYKVVR